MISLLLLSLLAGPGPKGLSFFPTPGLTGSVVSSINRRPLMGLAVQPLATAVSNGYRSVIPLGDPVFTDRSGRFRITGLPPGDYFLEISSASARVPAISLIDPQHPPGAPPPGIFRRILPYSAVQDGSAELGIVQVTDTAIMQIPGELHAQGCQPDSRFTVELFERFGDIQILASSIDIPCNRPFVLNTSPGSYRLTARSTGSAPARFQCAQKDLNIGAQNAAIFLEAHY